MANWAAGTPSRATALPGWLLTRTGFPQVTPSPLKAPERPLAVVDVAALRIPLEVDQVNGALVRQRLRLDAAVRGADEVHLGPGLCRLAIHRAPAVRRRRGLVRRVAPAPEAEEQR